MIHIRIYEKHEKALIKHNRQKSKQKSVLALVEREEKLKKIIFKGRCGVENPAIFKFVYCLCKLSLLTLSLEDYAAPLGLACVCVWCVLCG